jgi:hypothetical protein
VRPCKPNVPWRALFPVLRGQVRLLRGRLLIEGHGFWFGAVVDRDAGRQRARPRGWYGWGWVSRGIRDRLRFAVGLLLLGPRHRVLEQSECT